MIDTMLFRRIGIPVVWIVALLGGLASVLLLPDEHRLRGLSVVLAACVLLTFAIQLAVPEQRGFVTRLTASLVGAFSVLLVISLAALPFG